MTPDVPVSNDIKSLWALITESSNNCPLDTRKDVCQNIVFYGESSLVRGIGDFANRVIKEHFPVECKPRCVFPPERRCSSWIGGSIWASLSSSQRLWITKKEYDEIGPYAMSKRCYQFGHTRAGDFKSYFEQEVSFYYIIIMFLCTNPFLGQINETADKVMEKFNRGKISLFGDGRMGKTAFARSVKGDPFEQTASTVGIEENMMEFDMTKGASSTDGDWQTYSKPERQFEAAIAKVLHATKNDDINYTERVEYSKDGPTRLNVIVGTDNFSADAMYAGLEALIPIDLEKSNRAAEKFRMRPPVPIYSYRSNNEEEEPKENLIALKKRNQNRKAQQVKKQQATDSSKSSPNKTAAAAALGVGVLPGAKDITTKKDTDEDIQKVAEEVKLDNKRNISTCDEDYVAKYLSNSIHTSSKLSISLLDFGGK